MDRKKGSLLCLAAILVIAAAFRFWGLWWGLPDRCDLHPDESDHVIGHVCHLSLSDPDPHFLNYPSLLLYTVSVGEWVGHRLGLLTEPWQTYLLGRAIVATYGTATCAVVFLMALELDATLLGALLAGLFVALLPLHIWESHVAVTDVVMTFWTTLTLYASLRLARAHRLRDYAWTGVALGFAVASKYTAALVAIAPLAMVRVARRPIREATRGLAWLGFVALLCFFIGTPFSVLHFQETFRDLLFESAHVHGGHAGFSNLAGDGFQYHAYVYQLLAAWPFSFGFALYALVLVAFAWHLWRRPWKGRTVLFAFIFLFFGVTGSWSFTPLRYYLPILVPMALLAGLAMGHWLRAPARALRWSAAAALALVLSYTLLFAFQTTARYHHDTRILAAHWLKSHLAPGQSLLLCGDHRYHAFPTIPGVTIRCRNEAAICYPHRLRAYDLVAISSLHYDRWYRIRRPHHLRFGYKYVRSGEHGFHLVKKFEASFVNRALYQKLDPMFGGYFVSPTLEFYVPDKAGSPTHSAG